MAPLAERTIRVQQILTDKEALEARRRYESGESVASITRSLSTPKRPVSRETVRKIVQRIGTAYSHLEEH